MADGGIEFLIDINAKYQEATGAAKALDQVAESSQKTDKAVSGVESEFQRLQKQLTGLRRPAQIAEMRKEIESLKNPEPAEHVGFLGEKLAEAKHEALGLVAGLGVFAVGEFIVEGISHLVEKVHELGVEMLMTAGEAQRTDRAVTALMGADVAPEILEWIERMAKSTEFTEGPLKQMAVNLARAGFKGEDLSRAMSATVDVASMYTNKLEGVGVATEKLSRIRLKGGVSDRDLLGLGIEPRTFYKKLAADLGMGQKEVEKKLLEGKIKSEDVIEEVYNAIAAKTGKDLGGAGLGMTGTFLSQVEKFKEIIPNLFKKLADSEGLDHLSDSLEHLVDNLAPDSPNGKRIIDGLDQMLNAFAHLIDEIDWEKFTNTAVRLFEALPPLVEMTTRALEGLFHILERIVSRGSLSGGIGETIGKAIGLGDKGAGAMANLAEWVDHPVRKVSEIGHKIGSSLGDGVVGGLNESGGMVYDAMGNMVGRADAGLRDAAEIHSPSRRFRRLGALTAEGYERGILDQAPDISQAFKVVFSPMTGPLSPDGYAPPASASGAPPGPQGQNLVANVEINIGTVTGDEKGARMVADEAAASIRMAIQRLAEELFAEGA